MDILIKSLLSGLVTAAILLIAKFSGPRLAGAIGGVPIVFAISYIFVTMASRSSSKEFLIGGVYGAIAAIFFSIVLIFFNYKFPQTHWINFSVAYILCFALVLGLVHVTSTT